MKLARLVMAWMVSCLFLQEAGNFYWLYHVFLNKGADPSQVIFALGWFPLLPAFLTLFLAGTDLDPLPSVWSGAFFFFTLVLSIGFCLGLVNSSDPQHFIGDVGKFVVPWAALYLTLRAGTTLVREGGMKALEPFLWALLGLSLFAAAETSYFGLTTGQHIFVHLYFLALAWAMVQDRFPFWISLPVAAFCAKAAVYSNKRYCIVLMLFTLASSLLYLALAGRVKRLAGMGLAFVLGGALATSVLWTSADSLLSGNSNTLSRFSNILEIVQGQAADSSYQARKNEGANVLDHLQKHPEFWATGLGFGAEIPTIYPTGNMLDSGTIHHVHMAVYAFLLRNGLLGVLLLFLFIYKTLEVGGRLLKPGTGWAVACLIFCAGKAVGVLTNDFILGTTDVSIIAGLGFAAAQAAQIPSPEEDELVARPERGTLGQVSLHS